MRHVPDLLSDPSRPGATIAHVDLSEPELPEPQFPEPQFPELKLPTPAFSTPLANPEEIPDLPPRSDVLGVADFHRQDVVSCARDAFAHLQAAVAGTGPAAPPMDAAQRSALEVHIEHLDRESDEHEAGLMYVASSDLIHPGSA